jgi:hypothetical protein
MGRSSSLWRRGARQAVFTDQTGVTTRLNLASICAGHFPAYMANCVPPCLAYARALRTVRGAMPASSGEPTWRAFLCVISYDTVSGRVYAIAVPIGPAHRDRRRVSALQTPASPPPWMCRRLRSNACRSNRWCHRDWTDERKNLRLAEPWRASSVSGGPFWESLTISLPVALHKCQDAPCWRQSSGTSKENPPAFGN